MSLSELEPKAVWKHFEAILRIPRPSGHEEAIRNHVLSWAARCAFAVDSDEAGNLFIRVPSSVSDVIAPEVMLQAHLDMVAEKEPDCATDFLRDPIEAVVDGELVRSVGTTLGADNGIGLATAMAVAEDQDVRRGPLLLVFTVDEERGLTGAKGLEGSKLRGTKLINLDSEDDAIYIGCAGAQDCRLLFVMRKEDAEDFPTPVRVSVEGLEGGHSGVDIGRNGGNAIKILARVLYTLQKEGIKFRLASLGGGGSRNAIPREAAALLRVPAGSEEVVRAAIEQQIPLIQREFSHDQALNVSVARVPRMAIESSVWSEEDQAKIIRFLIACPHGVLAMSRAVPGLVETSNNLAILKTTAETVEICTLTRSSGSGPLVTITEQIQALGELAGAEFSLLGGYPAWEPDPDSGLVRTAKKIFRRLNGRSAQLKAVHAGLECGIIGAKADNLEMISLGPSIEGAHTPRERVWIASVGSFYKLLAGILSDLAITKESNRRRE